MKKQVIGSAQDVSIEQSRIHHFTAGSPGVARVSMQLVSALSQNRRVLATDVCGIRFVVTGAHVVVRATRQGDATLEQLHEWEFIELGRSIDSPVWIDKKNVRIYPGDFLERPPHSLKGDID